MASERQIAANRRNARKSTGPRSSAGKKQSRRNSFRHGFAARAISNAGVAKQIEEFARELAGDTSDAVIIACARDAAHSEFDIAQIRRVKVALIERMATFGQFEAPQFFEPVKNSNDDVHRIWSRYEYTIPETNEALDTMPSTGPERMAEAVRRALPALLKLDRYEHRAASLRMRSLRALLIRTEQNHRATPNPNTTQR